MIYNATTQQALMLPATPFRAHVINCESKQADPICDELTLPTCRRPVSAISRVLSTRDTTARVRT